MCHAIVGVAVICLYYCHVCLCLHFCAGAIVVCGMADIVLTIVVLNSHTVLLVRCMGAVSVLKWLLTSVGVLI